jgi:hypothetical protein
MRDSNFLQDALRAAATEPLDTCTLCGAIINRSYEDAHNHFHHADYQPFATDTPGAAAVTCKLCGILINRSYWDTQPRSRVGRRPANALQPDGSSRCTTTPNAKVRSHI